MQDWKDFLEARRNEWAESFRVHNLLGRCIRNWLQAIAVMKYKRETKKISEAFGKLSTLRLTFSVFYLLFLQHNLTMAINRDGNRRKKLQY